MKPGTKCTIGATARVWPLKCKGSRQWLAAQERLTSTYQADFGMEPLPDVIDAGVDKFSSFRKDNASGHYNYGIVLFPKLMRDPKDAEGVMIRGFVVCFKRFAFNWKFTTD